MLRHPNLMRQAFGQAITFAPPGGDLGNIMAAVPAQFYDALPYHVTIVVLAGVVLYIVPSSDFLLLPDKAHSVAPLVRVQGGKDPRGPGGIYFVDVFERRANMLESMFPFIRSGATLVPAKLIVPPGVSVPAATPLSPRWSAFPTARPATCWRRWRAPCFPEATEDDGSSHIHPGR